MRQSHVLVALITLAQSAYGQLAEVQPGARVRVVAPGIVAGRYVGTVLARSADTIRIGSPNAAPVNLPVDRLTSIEVSRGSSRALGAARGMLWGGPIGLAFGAVVASSDDLSNSYSVSYNGTTSRTSAWEIVAVSTVSGLLWGAGIGAILGRERWESFNLTPRTSIDLRNGRPGLAIRLRF